MNATLDTHQDQPLRRSDSATPTRRLPRVVWAVLIAAVLLRVVALDTYPTPYHQDELTDIYDGYSIATTGADRTGARWPILTRSMGPGGYCPALNVYLCALASSLGGRTVWVSRMPAVLGGMLTVWLVFVTARRLLGERGGFIALLLVSFTPISMIYARQIHMGVYLPPLFAILCVYLCDCLFVRASDKRAATPSWSQIALAGFVIGFSTHAYSGSRITAPLLAVAACVLLATALRKGRRSWGVIARGTGILTLGVLAGAGLTIYAAIATPEMFFSRSGHIMPPLANGPRWWIETLSANLAMNLDPRYLFLSFGEFRHLSVARLGVASLPFLYVGLIAIVIQSIRKRDVRLAMIPITIIIGLIPGVISTGNPNPMRTSIVWAMYPIATAYGALCVGSILLRIRQRTRTVGPSWETENDQWARLGFAAASLMIVVSGVWYVSQYVSRTDLHGRAAQSAYAEVGTWLRDHGSEYDRIYIDVDGVFGELYVAAFSGMTPAEYQRTPREGTVTAMGWDKFRRLGRYYFDSTDAARQDWQQSSQDERWLIVRSVDDMLELEKPVKITTTKNTSDDVRASVSD